MTNTKQLHLNQALAPASIISCIFGILVIAAGLLNFRYGNDPIFGLFLIGAAFIYFPPFMSFIENKIGFRLHFIFKILLAAFLFIAIMGVGEFFDKWDMMMNDFK